MNIQTPDQDLIAYLQSQDSRVKYLPFEQSRTLGGATIDERGNISNNPLYTVTIYDYFDQSSFPGLAVSSVYDEFAFPALERTLKESYQLPVGLRGIVVNIGEPFTTNGGRVKSTLEVLTSGEDQDKGYVLQTIFDDDGQGINFRTKQWVVQSTQELRKKVTPEQGNLLFPAIVVYDLAGFVAKKSFSIPQDPAERAKVILGIYILDYILA